MYKSAKFELVLTVTYLQIYIYRSSKHKVKTLDINILALSRDDDKRITVNGINSLAGGHYKLPT